MTPDGRTLPLLFAPGGRGKAQRAPGEWAVKPGHSALCPGHPGAFDLLRHAERGNEIVPGNVVRYCRWGFASARGRVDPEMREKANFPNKAKSSLCDLSFLPCNQGVTSKTVRSSRSRDRKRSQFGPEHWLRFRRKLGSFSRSMRPGFPATTGGERGHSRCPLSPFRVVPPAGTSLLGHSECPIDSPLGRLTAKCPLSDTWLNSTNEPINVSNNSGFVTLISRPHRAFASSCPPPRIPHRNRTEGTTLMVVTLRRNEAEEENPPRGRPARSWVSPRRSVLRRPMIIAYTGNEVTFTATDRRHVRDHRLWHGGRQQPQRRRHGGTRGRGRWLLHADRRGSVDHRRRWPGRYRR